jgi:uncharacterized protein (DUF302 family)
MLLTLLLLVQTPVPDTLTRVASPHPVAETADRLERTGAARGLTRFARIDHGANAVAAGLELRPTILLILGNPAVGTRLMHCAQTAAIALPLHILVWEDEAGQVWVGWEPPPRLTARHPLEACLPVLERMAEALPELARQAIADP